MKKKILILCTGNSCRSQIAEGVLKYYGATHFEVYSAGTKPSQVNPTAIQVMNEIGIDISNQYSKHVNELAGQHFDYVITVCDHAKESCPIFPGKTKTLHWPFPDPPHDQEITQEALEEFRRVRDLIHDKFQKVGQTGVVG